MSTELQSLKCPHCAEMVQPQAMMCRFCKRGLSLLHFQECKFCGEMIRRSARKCRFCFSNLQEPPSARPPANAPVPKKPISPLKVVSEVLPLPEPETRTVTVSRKQLRKGINKKESN